ncbi:MAG TPA: hypothetical protein VIS74_03320 [Chthoniobacterales bacterium]
MDQTPKPPEENDALWELLGNARPPQASPFFASRVVHAARAESRERVPLLHFLLRPALALAAVAGLGFAAALFLEPRGSTQLASQDFEILSNLENLAALDTPTQWDDSSAYFQ